MDDLRELVEWLRRFSVGGPVAAAADGLSAALDERDRLRAELDHYSDFYNVARNAERESDRLRDLIRWISEEGLTPATETAIRMILAPQEARRG